MLLESDFLHFKGSVVWVVLDTEISIDGSPTVSVGSERCLFRSRQVVRQRGVNQSAPLLRLLFSFVSFNISWFFVGLQLPLLHLFSYLVSSFTSRLLFSLQGRVCLTLSLFLFRHCASRVLFCVFVHSGLSLPWAYNPPLLFGVRGPAPIIMLQKARGSWGKGKASTREIINLDPPAGFPQITF